MKFGFSTLRTACLILACWLWHGAANAQSHRQQVRAKVDSVLTTRYYKTPYDTNYVVRPHGTLTLKATLSQTGNTFHVKGTVNDVYRSKAIAARMENMIFRNAYLIAATRVKKSEK